LSRLSRTIEDLTESLEGYHFHAAAHRLYDFAWHSLCDWYLEAVKPRLYGSRPESKRVAQKVLAAALGALVRMLHPFIPFITEEIWRHLNGLVPDRGLFTPREAGETIVLAEWPKPDWFPTDDEAEKSMALVTEIIRAVRNIRSKHNLGERKEVSCLITGTDREALNVVRDYEYFICNLGLVDGMKMGSGLQKPRAAAAEVVGPLELYVPLEGLIDLGEEHKRLEARIEKARQALAGVENKLANPNFIERAPDAIVERERRRHGEMLAEVRKLEANLADFSA